MCGYRVEEKPYLDPYNENYVQMRNFFSPLFKSMIYKMLILYSQKYASFIPLKRIVLLPAPEFS
jgi:hypothetical protein